LSHVSRSKLRVRHVILDALSYGSDGRKRAPSNGAIIRLLQKLDSALDSVMDSDIDSIKKIADTYLKLAALAMPTAAQTEALDKGLAPGNILPAQDFLAVLEAHLVKRRQLLSKAIPTESVVIESRPSLSDIARQELSKRHAKTTPSPAPGSMGGMDEIGGRVPTVSQVPPVGISGTKIVDAEIQALPLAHVDVDDLDFSE
jgi:hypothetical protein